MAAAEQGEDSQALGATAMNHPIEAWTAETEKILTSLRRLAGEQLSAGWMPLKLIDAIREIEGTLRQYEQYRTKGAA